MVAIFVQVEPSTGRIASSEPRDHGAGPIRGFETLINRQGGVGRGCVAHLDYKGLSEWLQKAGEREFYYPGASNSKFHPGGVKPAPHGTEKPEQLIFWGGGR